MEELRQLRTDDVIARNDLWSMSDGQFLDTLARCTDHEVARWLAWARVNRVPGGHPDTLTPASTPAAIGAVEAR